MIDAIPAVRWVYTNIFCRGFGYCFVVLSALRCIIHDRILPDNKEEEIIVLNF